MKDKIIEILQSETSEQKKFNALVPIFRENSEAKNELRNAVNLGFTEFRLKKVQEFLMNKFGITENDLKPAKDNDDSNLKLVKGKYNDLTKAELLEELSNRKIEVKGKPKKDDLIQMLEENDALQSNPGEDVNENTEGKQESEKQEE